MLYLPPCLGALSTLAARENPRYAVSCLRVFEYAEDRYRIEATDGRRLLIVRGQGGIETPFGQPLDDPAHEGLVPAESWREGFKKLFKKRPGREPFPVGLSINAARFRFSNPSEEINGDQPTEADGRRFPEVNAIIPRKLPAFSVRVDPTLLAGLLEVASKLMAEDDRGVWLHFYKKDAPMGISGKNVAAGLHFDGMFMPIG